MIKVKPIGQTDKDHPYTNKAYVNAQVFQEF